MSGGRPPRPDPLAVEPEAIPGMLRDRDQWVCWRYKWDSGRDEWTKAPIDVSTGRYASSTDPETWASFADALAYHENGANETDGLGLVVHEGGIVVGLDLDDCRDSETGEREEWADSVIDAVPTYGEVSPSGTGLRLFGLGFVPDSGNRGDIDGENGHLEMYDSGRYLTVTGHRVDETTEDVTQVNDEIAEIHAEYIADDKSDNSADLPDTKAVEAGSRGANPTPDGARTDLGDDELLEKARNAGNADKFRRLWEGRTVAGLDENGGQSERDLALTGLLAFWTGGNKQQIDRLFRRSDLMRGKWDADRGSQTYGERTISKALKGRTDFYNPGGGKQRATDGGAVAANTEDEGPSPDATADRDSLTPMSVMARAGLGEDDDISDLTDREKAACVWDLIEASNDVHVRVRRDNGSLWAYDGGVWEPDGERALRHAARKALGSMNYGANVLAELKAQARSDPRAEVEAETFGVDTGYLAVKNGLVDLEAAADGAGEDAIRDLQPDDLALTQLPVEYNPSAGYDEWGSYVEEWAENGRADALQEYVGYCLHVGALPIHRALLLVGSGANGKGTFLSVVRALLGPENTASTELQTLANERDAVADFYGALANIDDDLSARKLGAGLGMFKKLVGGDRVRARQLYQDAFEFDAVGKHLYAANEVPKVDVSDNDEAFWRRWLLVEFPNYYPPADRDPDLRDRLTNPEALSGVLNWAIEGRNRLLDKGFFTNEDRLAHDKRVRWQSWGDTVDEFIAECVEHDDDADRITTGEAYQRFTAWCRANGEDPDSRRSFTDRLKTEDVGYGKHRIEGSVQRGYKSLGFSDDVPEVDHDEEEDDDDGYDQGRLN